MDLPDFLEDGVQVGDLPPDIQPGTPAAKQWWYENIQSHLADNITPEMKQKYGDQVIGAYKGKALVPGSSGLGQGDFEYLVDQLVITTGIDQVTAQKIAGKAFWTKYGTLRSSM